MKNRLLCLTAAVVVGSAALTGCGGDDDTTKTDDGLSIVRVANLPVAATMLVAIADEQGYFEDNGIKVEVTNSSELATFIPALDKQYDVVMTTPSDFLASGAKGFDIAVLGGAWADGAGVYSKDAASIDDLAGKKIATNSLTGLQYAMLQDSLETAGVEAELVQVPFASQPDQAKAGQVDAATVPEPFASSLAEAGFTRVFTPIEEATGETDALTGWYSTTRDFADANPEVVEGWDEAMGSAIEWIDENNADYRALLVDELELDQATAEAIEMPTWTVDVSAEQLAVYIGPLVRQGQLDDNAEDLDLSTFVLDN